MPRQLPCPCLPKQHLARSGLPLPPWQLLGRMAPLASPTPVGPISARPGRFGPVGHPFAAGHTPPRLAGAAAGGRPRAMVRLDRFREIGHPAAGTDLHRVRPSGLAAGPARGRPRHLELVRRLPRTAQQLATSPGSRGHAGELVPGLAGSGLARIAAQLELATWILWRRHRRRQVLQSAAHAWTKCQAPE